ncbi:SLC7A9 (predicted) [Pycnogonum litorale]
MDNSRVERPKKVSIDGNGIASNGYVHHRNPSPDEFSSSTYETSEASSEMIPDEIVQLKRRVGLFSGTALIVGTMIGSGIFVSPKGVFERTGSIGLCLIVWGACGILAMLGALAYGELGTMLPNSGAEYTYLDEAFGGLPAFMFAWLSVFVLKPSMLAIIALSFGEYIVEPLSHGCTSSGILIKIIATLTVALITFINCYSVSVATKIQNIFTAAKLVAIAIIIVCGIVKMAEGNVQFIYKGFEGSTSSFSDIATALYSGLWAYDGWNNLNYVTEELINPFTNLPRAISIGLPLVTICYVLVNFSYFAVMTSAELVASDAVALTFGNRVLGFVSWIMPLAVALSTFGAGNGTCFTSGRLAFVAARKGHLSEVMAFVHVRKLTPSPALIFNAIIAILMLIPGNIGTLIDFFSFTAWLFYGATMLALIVMRWTRPNMHRPYKVPLIIPVIVMIVSVYLVIAPIVDNPAIEYLYAILFIVAGFVFYVPFVCYKVQLKFMAKLTAFLQLVLEVVPTNYVPEA